MQIHGGERFSSASWDIELEDPGFSLSCCVAGCEDVVSDFVKVVGYRTLPFERGIGSFRYVPIPFCSVFLSASKTGVTEVGVEKNGREQIRLDRVWTGRLRLKVCALKNPERLGNVGVISLFIASRI